VTGASGRLGRAVVEDLLGYGYEITFLDSVSRRGSKCPVSLVDPADLGPAIRR
jgi:nucleoside-diphosphate-sugar epimerase